MKKVIYRFIAVSFLSLVASGAGASLIVNSTFTAGELVLSESFEEFYDYAGDVKASSNTGYEVSETLVLLLITFEGDYGLVGLMDKPDNTSGGLTIALTDNSQTRGAFTLYDDPKETGTTSANTTTSSWNWAAGFSDGFIYTIGDISDVDISLDFTIKSGITNIAFYNFDFGSRSQLIDVTDSSLTLTSVNVPADTELNSPNAFVVFFLGVFLMLTRKARVHLNNA